MKKIECRKISKKQYDFLKSYKGNDFTDSELKKLTHDQAGELIRLIIQFEDTRRI